VPSLWDVLTLDQLDDDLFRTRAIEDERDRLYGGQVAAQALLAAGATVPGDRVPHSFHAYFLRRGKAGASYDLRVIRDLEGNRYSSRRVEAIQDGELLFTMSASFQVPSLGHERQLAETIEAEDPESLEPNRLALLLSIDYRIPTHPEAEWLSPPHPGAKRFLPTRFWARCELALPDEPLLHAAVQTYISDWSSGMVAGHRGQWHPSTTLDHTMWFHRPLRLDDWVLFHLAPRNASGGRGWYSGTVHDRDGVHGTTFAQEGLYGRIRETE
ncbi:MAG TPA: acyl-CoA thioesterase domain-containing protein, partial [Jatrophihabitans sp.]|jgi:acyl-CoA thioesterase-2